MPTPPVHPDLLPRLLLGEPPGGALGPALDALWGLAIVLFVFLPAISAIGFLAIWAERKVAGRLQHRHGPNRVGRLGEQIGRHTSELQSRLHLVDRKSVV